MIADAEKIIGAYLRTETAQRVVGTTPSSIEDPWIRLTLIDDESMDDGAINRSMANYFQLDCFAGRNGTQATARALAIEARNLLHDAENRTLAGAVVSGATTRMSHQPDTQYEPQMERYAVTATVWMHT